MAKKETRETIPPYKCVRALDLFNERIFGYRQSFESMLEHIKSNPSGNKELDDFIIRTAEKHQSGINEFYNHE